jgi:hypothetical protein
VAKYLPGWMIFGLWKLDFGSWIENWEIFGCLGEFWAIGIFGFSNFHRSNLLDKRLVIRRIFSKPHGNWTLKNP